MRQSHGKVSQKRVARRIPFGIAARDDGLFFGLLKRDGLPLPHPEFVFAHPRKWRFDYAWCDLRDPSKPMLALEVEGGVWTRGRHTRGAGFLKDCEKYNEAACRGWRLIRVTPKQLCTLETVALIRRALNL